MIEGFWRIIINIDELWWWWWWWWWVHARKYKGSEMVSSSKGLDVPSFHIGGYDFRTWFLISHHKPWWTMIEGSATHYDELIWTMIMMNSDDDGSFTESIWVLKWYPQALGWKLFPSISRVMILEPPPLPDSHWLFNICLGHHKPRSNMIEGFWRIIINIDELWWWWWWWWWWWLWVHARKYKGSEMVSSSKGLDVPSFHIAGYDFWTWFLISHHKPWWTMTEGSAAHCDELIWTIWIIYIYIALWCYDRCHLALPLGWSRWQPTTAFNSMVSKQRF